MVYSNALYFASQFDKLTEEVLSTFNEKQKSRKNINLEKIPFAKTLLALRGKETKTWLERIEEEIQNTQQGMETVILFVETPTAKIATRWVFQKTLNC